MMETPTDQKITQLRWWSSHIQRIMNKMIVKPLSHQLAMHWRPTILDISPVHRQTSSVHCHYIVSGRQPSWTLRQAWRFFWNVKKNRQASPVNIVSSIGCQRFANHRHAIPAARQCVVNRSSVFLLVNWWRLIWFDFIRSSKMCIT